MRTLVLSAVVSAVLTLACQAESFDRVLEGPGFSVRIASLNTGEKNTVTVTPQGLPNTKDPVTVAAGGRVARAFLADMDSDNSPELFIVLSLPGSGSQGGILAFSTNGKKSLTPIIIEEPAEKDLVGYAGGDEFEVMENTLVRRFPVSKDGSPTGGYRQFQYKLKAGEAAWHLKIDRVESY